MHQQLLEKAQSKYLLSTEKKVYVQRIAVEPAAILGIHMLFHEGCPFKVCFLCINEEQMFPDVILPIKVLLKWSR